MFVYVCQTYFPTWTTIEDVKVCSTLQYQYIVYQVSAILWLTHTQSAPPVVYVVPYSRNY